MCVSLKRHLGYRRQEGPTYTLTCNMHSNLYVLQFTHILYNLETLLSWHRGFHMSVTPFICTGLQGVYTSVKQAFTRFRTINVWSVNESYKAMSSMWQLQCKWSLFSPPLFFPHTRLANQFLLAPVWQADKSMPLHEWEVGKSMSSLSLAWSLEKFIPLHLLHETPWEAEKPVLSLGCKRGQKSAPSPFLQAANFFAYLEV